MSAGNTVTSKPNHLLHLRGEDLSLDSPAIMGVLNATPDSFSDGGEFNAVDAALKRIEEMINQGADIIDIGGESTRPGAEPVPVDTERGRVLPILEKAISQFSDCFFSVDTRKYTVAKEALEAGVHIVNDVSGLTKEPRLAGLCAEFNAGYILMHSQGDPQHMQDNPQYDAVIEDVKSFLQRQAARAADAGLTNIVVDPGIGFGKTLQHNLTLIRELDSFVDLGFPIMIGASRKSMLDEILGGRSPKGRVAATVAVHYEAMLQGARILRVHDVQEAWDSVCVYKALHNS